MNIGKNRNIRDLYGRTTALIIKCEPKNPNQYKERHLFVTPLEGQYIGGPSDIDSYEKEEGDEDIRLIRYVIATNDVTMKSKVIKGSIEKDELDKYNDKARVVIYGMLISDKYNFKVFAATDVWDLSNEPEPGYWDISEQLPLSAMTVKKDGPLSTGNTKYFITISKDRISHSDGGSLFY